MDGEGWNGVVVIMVLIVVGSSQWLSEVLLDVEHLVVT